MNDASIILIHKRTVESFEDCKNLIPTSIRSIEITPNHTRTYQLKMDFLGLTMFSIFMALISYFKPGSLTAINAVGSIPERLQEGLRKDHSGGRIDKNSPTIHSNDSSMSSVLQPDAFSIPTANSELNTPFGNLTVSDSVSTVADWDEFDPWYFHDTNQRFGPVLNFLDSAGFSNLDSLSIKNSVKITGLLGLSVVLVGVGVVISNFWRHLKTADDEVMGFTNAVRSKRALLLHRLDLVAFVLDKQLDQVSKQIMLKQKRVHEELASFRFDCIEQEINTFREAFESDVQAEVDQLVSRVKDLLRELEESDPAKVRAQYEELQGVVRRSKEAYGKLNDSLKQIESLSDSSSTRQNKDLPVSQDVTVPVQDELPDTRTPSTDTGLSDSKTKEGAVGSAENRYHNEAGKRTTPLAQWVMSSARRAMTREEIDNEWKIRRERAMMRRTSTHS